MIKNLLFWLALTVIMMSSFQNIGQKKNYPNIEYSNFLLDIKKDKIQEVKINGKEINVIKKNYKKYKTYIPINDSELLNKLINKKIKISSIPRKEPSFITSILVSWLPIILITGLWIFLVRQIQNNSNKKTFFFGKSKAKILNKNNIKTTFKDVAGCNEAKEDVKELVEFLKTPEKFKKLGGKIPKGILMIGPPGTGKTLLAKAIAGEAQVPFYSISGSDFVEMFVGVGASRVRDMFYQAKKNSPCIIFIDEIDAVGRQRGINISGGNDEREQTLNQMLVEMDGFDSDRGIIIIAATNRPDILDPALLRPGRFDRRVIVDLPDIEGRKKIIKIHTKNIPLNKNVNIKVIAQGTPGFSGADLFNLVNEATLIAAKKNFNHVSMNEFEKARDKIIMGAERKSLIINDYQKELIAYHECGHTIVSQLVPEHDPVHKVTIIPRGKSLGSTFFLPENDNLNINKKQLESKISTLYGGRLAEEIIYGKENISIGSSNDIKIASNIARNMVTKWGFSDKVGPLSWNKNNENIINENYKNIFFSNYISNLIDKEIKKIVKKNYLRAKKILLKNIHILHKMKKKLLKYETLNKKEIKKIIFYKKFNQKK